MKHKTRTKALSWLLSLALALSLLPGLSLPAQATGEYPLWVNGVQVTSENKGDVLGNSTVTYTPAAGTTPAALTLNNANITKGYPDGPGESGIYYDGAAPLDIVLAKGSKNIIKKIADEGYPDVDFKYGGIYSINTNAAVTISGTGKLTAKGGYAGIKAEKDVTIKSGNVSAEGLAVGISAANAVTIKGGTVAATATVNSGDAHGIIGGQNVTIEGGVVIASATGNDGDGIKAHAGDVVIRDGDITASGKAKAIVGRVKNAIAGTGWTNTEGTDGEASIEVNTTGQELTYKKVHIKAVSYGVWVGGEEVTSANLFGEGWSYTPATEFGWPACLTLNGYSYEGTGHAGNGNTFSGAIYAEQDLEIKLDGGSSNSVISAGNDAATSCAIYVAGKLTISGSGSLTASGPMGIVCGENMTVRCDPNQIPSGSITVTGSSGSGIHSVNGNIEIQDGNLTVNGSTCGVSTGNHTGNGVGDLTIIGGTLTVNSDGDYGICVKKMVLNDYSFTRSTVTATGTEQAISAETVTVDECMYVKAGADKDNSSPVENTSTWTHMEKWVKAKVFPEVYVGGTQVTRSVRGGDGWSFDPDTDTLTLNGYSYEDAGYLDADAHVSGGIYARQSLNIELKGDNTVINTLNSNDFDEYGIHVAGKLSISGTGTLTAQGVNGILASRDITIESGTVNVTDTGSGIMGGCICSAFGNVTINGGTVNATGGSQQGGISAYHNVTINGGTVNATATGQESYALCAGAVVTINGGTVTARGNTQAISGTVKNAIAGTGWTNTEGTVGKASIPISTDGQTLDSYKKIQFLGHTHTFTSYTLNDAKDTITAECSNMDTLCTLPPDANTKRIATLTITPKDDGTATLTGGADFSVTDADIKYYSQGESSSWTPITGNGGKPSGEGFFKASITVGEGENAKTAEVKYGVNEVKLDKAYTNESDYGTIPDANVPSVATIGATVRIPTIPAAGYQLMGITASGASNVSKDGNTGTFTMPNSEVTVSAEFEKRNVGVSLAVVKDYVTEESVKASCSAALLKDDAGFTPVGNSFTSQVDDTFILRVDSDEAYDFTITGTTPLEFIQLDKAKKQSYVRTHPDVDANTQLFLVTMPGVQEGDLTVTVTFQKIKTYTILFQPNNPAAFSTVWCKVANEFGGQNTSKSFQLKMNPDAQMGNVKTFAVTVSMLAAPQKIAFGVSELADNVEMMNVSVKENAADAQTWQMQGSDKFLVISGNARTVIAAFTPNITAFTARTDDVRNLPANTKYQIAVCGVGAAGTVKAPAALTKNGFTFVGWGYKSGALGLNEKDTYDEGDDISITDDAIFGAVWTPVTPTVTVNLKGGDINGNTDSVTISNVQYNEAIREALQNILPKKNGFVLDGWTVNANVTEGGKFFSRGSAFDPNTNITSNLELNAKWKHVHSYTCVPLDYAGFGDALKDYYEYRPYMHVKFCGCYDVELEAHSFENGVCTGCKASESGGDPTLTLDVSYWKDGEDGAWMREATRTGLKENEEVTVSAFYQIGDYRFSKWQYRFSNEDSWKDIAADTMVGFLIPASMQVRALYTLVEVQPQVSLSASKYVTEAEGHEWDTVLFQMEYKLPSNCTYIDSGIRMGDNQGISFYSLRKRKVSAFETAFNFITSDPISFAADSLTSDPDYIIEKREDNVLGTMNAATLAKYMMEKKPINIPEYEPIYWQANPATKGRSGSVNTLTPLRFIQKNNGNHYIYGVAYLRFKDRNGEHTIYTEAIPVTRNTIPEKNTVTKTFTPN